MIAPRVSLRKDQPVKPNSNQTFRYSPFYVM